MKRFQSEWAAGTATGLLMLYLAGVLLAFPVEVVAWLLLPLPVAVVIMVFIILTDEKISDKTFEEFFYEDFDYRRNAPGQVS